MMTAQYTFKRIEKKYRLTAGQQEDLLRALAGRMCPDAYGLHTIGNLYFDTEDFQIIRASIQKPVYKEKLRLRSYGTPKEQSTVFMELKKKFKGVVYKRRVSMRLPSAMAFIEQGQTPLLRAGTTDAQVLREIDWFQKTYRQPIPRAMIAYERIALFSETEPELRVTFDSNIRFRDTQLDLSRGTWGASLMGKDELLMEIKIPGVTPLWLSDILSSRGIFPTSYSKYGTAYADHILPKLCLEGGLRHAS